MYNIAFGIDSQQTEHADGRSVIAYAWLQYRDSKTYFVSSHFASEIKRVLKRLTLSLHARIQGGRQVVQTPPSPGKSQSFRIGFLSVTGSDPLEINKATKPAFNVGPLSARQQTPFKWRFAGGQIMARI